MSRQNEATAACEMAMLGISAKSTAWVLTNESSIWWLIVARALGAKTTVLAKPEGEVQVDDGLSGVVDCVYALRAWMRREKIVVTSPLYTILSNARALQYRFWVGILIRTEDYILAIVASTPHSFSKA